MRAAIYARVSTLDQEPENQLAELRRYVEARNWPAVEYVDRGVSGSKKSRPALDRAMADARRRRFDVLLCWRLDRLGRNLKHLIEVLDELRVLGVEFVTLGGEGVDTTTAAGKLQLHILAALAEFERDRLGERVQAGVERARANGVKFGRPQIPVTAEQLSAVQGLTIREAARRLGVSPATAYRRLVSKVADSAASVSP